MAYSVDLAPVQDPHVSYEPSTLDGLLAAPTGTGHQPYVEGRLVRAQLEKTNDFGQTGERWRAFSDVERD